MQRKIFYVLVEGSDDERFFGSSWIRSRLMSRGFSEIRVVPYRQLAKAEVNKRIDAYNSLVKKGLAEYVFIADFDKSSSQCISQRKNDLIGQYVRLNAGCILVVREEIESWYVAGQSGVVLRRLGINKTINQTNVLTKEDFERLKPKRFLSTQSFMSELLETFDIPIAKRKNFSFSYFHRKYLL